MSKVIEMRGIEKSFFIGKPHELHILKGIDFDVEKGELSWSKLGTAYGYTVDTSHNDNTSQFTHETLEAQKNDSEHEYRTVVKVQYRNSESPHWVGVKDSKTIDGNDYSITETSLRGQQGWKKEGDHIYVPVNKTKGYVNFIKGKSS